MTSRANIVLEVLENCRREKKERLNPPPPSSSGTGAMLKSTPSSNPSTPQGTIPSELKISDDADLNFSAYSPRQKMFLSLYLSTGSVTEAAMRSYDCEDKASASSLGYYLINKLKIPFAAVMEARGITPGSLAKTLVQAQKSTKYVKTTSAGNFKKVPDHNVRLKAITLAGTWAGITPTSQANTNVQINNIIGDHRKKYDI